MDEIQITMLGPREVGKTSLLTALYGQLDLTIRGSGLNLWPDEETRLIIQKYKQNFQDLTNTLEGGPPPTSDARKSNLRSFTFEIGSGDKRSLKLIFKDPPGAYLSTLATDEQRKDAEDLLKECSVVVIPIDAAALMQKNSSQEVERGQVGTWHEEKNNAWYVTELLKNAYANLKSPRLVILAPIKCETYVGTTQAAAKLLRTVKNGYGELLDFFKSSSELISNVAVVVTPVQTVGNVTFSHVSNTVQGYTRFFYHKDVLNGNYTPQDGDQPLRYILRFFLNLHIVEQNQKRAELDRRLAERNQKRAERDQKRAKIKTKLQERKNAAFGLWKPIADFFYESLEPEVSALDDEIQKLDNKVSALDDEVRALDNEIRALNSAVFDFAVGCKNTDGFEIIQGLTLLQLKN